MASDDRATRDRGGRDARGGRSLRRAVVSNVALFAVLAVALVGMRVFLLGFYEIPSRSMADTLEVGDLLLGNKLAARDGSFARGDIVTFVNPIDEHGDVLIKRVIATGGQTVDLRDGKVVVDGRELDEPYTSGKPSLPLDQHVPKLAANVAFPYKVPEGSLWVMGDNRTESLDSRYFGAIPASSVTSRVFFRYWPLGSFGKL